MTSLLIFFLSFFRFKFHSWQEEISIEYIFHTIQVGETDSGRYSCRPSNTDVAVTMVYVIRGMFSRKKSSPVPKKITSLYQIKNMDIIILYAWMNSW